MPTPLQISTVLKISHWYFDQCLYPIKTSSSVKNILSKHFFYVLFSLIHEILSSMVNVIAVMTLYWRPVYIAASKEYLRRIKVIFMLLESAFHWLFCLKFSFKLVPFSRVMQENKSGVFFWRLCTVRAAVARLPVFLAYVLSTLCHHRLLRHWQHAHNFIFSFTF